MSSETTNLSIDDETPTCARCSPINFRNLRKTKQSRSKTLFTIHDLSQPLKDRHCRICQILETATDMHRSNYASAQVGWKRGLRNDTHLGTLEFTYSNGDTYKSLKPSLRIHHGEGMPRNPIIHPPKRVDFERAKTWINACKESHSGCIARSSKVFKSLRVIDCVTRSVISAPENCVYVALSYVWGMSETCDAPSSSALLDQLPLTVDNSIDATLMLRYRYLWVDRYCIDQTSAADKHDQINQMGDIYSSAELTLIAAAGTNSSYGLPGVGRDRKHLGHDVRVGRLRFVTTYEWDMDEIYHSVWSSRAWTFQEGYMSRRRLFFMEARLIYICDNNREVYCDAEIGFKDRRLDSLGHLSDSLPFESLGLSHAENLLKEYTRRKLTFDSDALNGIVGVLNTLSTAESPIFHTWGVTFGGSPLVIALAWFHYNPCRRRKAFPSWSPLGWERVADYYYNSAPVISPNFHVIVWDSNEFIQLSKVNQNLLQQSGAESLDKSRYLGITAKLGWLEVRYFSTRDLLSISWPTPTGKKRPQKVYTPSGFYVRLPDDDGDEGDTVEMYATEPPRWDLEPDHSSGLIRFSCAIIPQGHVTGRTFDEARTMIVIILQSHGTHYERIGSFKYPSMFRDNGILSRNKSGGLKMRSRQSSGHDYGDEELAKVFNKPMMQMFLLG